MSVRGRDVESGIIRGMRIRRGSEWGDLAIEPFELCATCQHGEADLGLKGRECLRGWRLAQLESSLVSDDCLCSSNIPSFLASYSLCTPNISAPPEQETCERASKKKKKNEREPRNPEGPGSLSRPCFG